MERENESTKCSKIDGYEMCLNKDTSSSSSSSLSHARSDYFSSSC